MTASAVSASVTVTLSIPLYQSFVEATKQKGEEETLDTSKLQFMIPWKLANAIREEQRLIVCATFCKLCA